MFKIGEEEFQTLKEFDQALKEVGYPHNVYVSLEQFVAMRDLPLVAAVDDAGVHVVVGLSRVRAHGAAALDTMDNPKWRKTG